MLHLICSELLGAQLCGGAKDRGSRLAEILNHACPALDDRPAQRIQPC